MRFGGLHADVIFRGAGRDGQPSVVRGTEASVFRCVPLHWCALAVAAFLFGPTDFPDGILDIFLASRRCGPHTNLFAVIHQRGLPRGEKESCHQLGNLIILSPIAIAVPLAGLIVVAEKEVGLAVGGVAVHFIQQPAELRGGELVHVGNLKIHGQLDFVVFRTVHFRELCNVRLVRLADQNGISRI